MKIARHQLLLRTLLLSVAGVALIFGLLSSWISRARQQHAAVNDLTECGFAVGYGAITGWRAEIGEKIGMDLVAAPKELFCNRPMHEPVGIEDIVKMKSIEHLTFNTSGVTDDDLALLDQLPNLKLLNLSSTGISDTGVEHLTKLALISLHIQRVPLTDASLESIAKIKSLKWLSVSAGQFSDSAIDKLRRLLPECTVNISK